MLPLPNKNSIFEYKDKLLMVNHTHKDIGVICFTDLSNFRQISIRYEEFSERELLGESEPIIVYKYKRIL